MEIVFQIQIIIYKTWIYFPINLELRGVLRRERLSE